LNRIKAVYSEVGVHKVDVLAKRVSETDPYIEQVHIKEGLNEVNLTSILEEHNPHVLVDEIDDLGMKIKIRNLARQYRKPVIMATDNGDNAILDIERYDTDQNQQAFEDRIPEEILTKIQEGTLSRPETGMLIGKYFVGTEHIPLRMFESLLEVGKTIPSWPQLASAATMSGVLCAYAAKKIILGQPLNSGRHLFDIDSSLDPLVSTQEYKQKTNDFVERFFS
jgi:molybdopterin/thiamine biosynthesis adenylyltransferase